MRIWTPKCVHEKTPKTFLIRGVHSKTNAPLREKDHTWDDLTDKELEIESLIIAAIDNIGKIEENIEVQNSMSSSDVDEYEKWTRENILSQIFEYKGNYFRVGFWIA